MQVFPNLLAMVAIFLILTQISNLADAIPQALPFLAGFDWSWIKLLGLNSLGGLILVYLGGVMGINTWLMKGFFDSIPRDIDESALVDGATHWQTLLDADSASSTSDSCRCCRPLFCRDIQRVCTGAGTPA